MYSQIAANKRRSFLIMGLFIALLAAIGYAYGLYVDNFNTVYVVLAFALLYSIISYFISARVALAVNGAKPIEKKDNPKLYRTVENLSIAAGLPMPKVYIIDDPAPNAFATGRDPAHASVAATTGLLEIMTDTELEAVIGHEMSHVQNYDIRLMMIVFACVSIIGLLSDFLVRIMWFGGDDRDRDAGPLGIVVALFVAVVAPIAATLVQLAVSRRRELLADASGVLLTRYPEGLISALKKIQQAGSATRRQSGSTAHLYFANPLKGKNLSRFFSTHPPIEERIAKLEEMGRTL